MSLEHHWSACAGNPRAGASEWSRHSEFLSDLAATLGPSAEPIDQMFRDADAIQS